MEYPFEWKSISEDEKATIDSLFEEDSAVRSYVISEPMKIYGQANFPTIAKKIYNFKVRPDDIWIVTYPKCGTTWTLELVWQIVNNLDIEAARKIPKNVRSPFIEDSATEPDLQISDGGVGIMDSVDQTANSPSPRVIKTHLPLEMLPPDLLNKCKVIFVGRSPKDCCVSYYHHYLNLSTLCKYNFKGTFPDFVQLFMTGLVGFGNYWTILKSAWKHKGHPNMKILWFEDMKKDLIPVIKDVCTFTGYQLTQDKILKLNDHLTFDQMKKVIIEQNEGHQERQDAMTKFMRKGKVGDWKNYFDNEANQSFDQWISENLSGTDIKLP